jgi:hypothetical protein
VTLYEAFNFRNPNFAVSGLDPGILELVAFSSTTMKLRIIIFALGLLPFSLHAGEDLRVQNLRDLSAFRVIVESLTPDARQAGVTEETLQSQVRAHFRESFPHISLVEKEGPSIYVRITLYKRKTEDLYYGMIGLSVDRPVMILSAKGDFPTLSQVWEKTAVFSGRDPLLGTFEILSKLLTLLIEDLKAENPPPR